MQQHDEKRDYSKFVLMSMSVKRMWEMSDCTCMAFGDRQF